MFKWFNKKEQPTNHQMIGKVYRLDKDDPFKEYFVKVTDVKRNGSGEEWVKFNMIFKNGIVYGRDNSERMRIFLLVYKEVK